MSTMTMSGKASRTWPAGYRVGVSDSRHLREVASLAGAQRAGQRYSCAATHAHHPPPAILGLDMAGTVEAVGPGVTRYRKGDEVYGMTGGVAGRQGSLAEFAAVDVDLLALKPANLSMREAAALPLIFITAWEGLIDRARLQAGQSVLVQGGSGGVGHMAIQIARAFGATVFATGAPSRRSVIERFGANFIDRAEPVADYVTRLI